MFRSKELYNKTLFQCDMLSELIFVRFVRKLNKQTTLTIEYQYFVLFIICYLRRSSSQVYKCPMFSSSLTNRLFCQQCKHQFLCEFDILGQFDMQNNSHHVTSCPSCSSSPACPTGPYCPTGPSYHGLWVSDFTDIWIFLKE